MSDRVHAKPGDRFGLLTVIGEGEPVRFYPEGKAPYKVRKIKCVCDCGGEKLCRLDLLRRGDCISCGCQKSKLKYDIGGRRTEDIPEWKTWRGMHNRCYVRSNKTYKFYGGKGVRICDRWHNFANFLEDMGEKPGQDFVIDRINPFGNYEPSNCRWQRREEAGYNIRNNVITPESAARAKAYFLAGMPIKGLALVLGCSPTQAQAFSVGKVWTRIVPDYSLLDIHFRRCYTRA